MTVVTSVTNTRLHVRRVSSFDAIAPSWSDLMTRDHSATFFSRPEWLESWWRHHGTGRELLLLAVFDDDCLVAVAPLMRRTRIRGTVQFIGTELSDYGDVIADDDHGYRNDAVRAVCEHIAAHHRHTIIDLQQIPSTSTTIDAICGWLKDRSLPWSAYPQATCHYQDLPTTVDLFDQEHSRNARQLERRRLRQLAEYGDVRFDRVTVIDDWSATAEEIASVTDDRATTMGYTQHWRGALGHWLIDALTTSQSRGAVWLCTLRVDDRLIAYDLLFHDDGVVRGYLHGFDTEFKKYSPGVMLSRYVRREAIAAGITRLDELRGSEPHKIRTANGHIVNQRIEFGVSAAADLRLSMAVRWFYALARQRARSSPVIVNARRYLQTHRVSFTRLGGRAS